MFNLWSNIFSPEFELKEYIGEEPFNQSKIVFAVRVYYPYSSNGLVHRRHVTFNSEEAPEILGGHKWKLENRNLVTLPIGFHKFWAPGPLTRRLWFCPLWIQFSLIPFLITIWLIKLLYPVNNINFFWNLQSHNWMHLQEIKWNL